MVLTKRVHLINSSALSLSRSHDPVTQDKPQAQGVPFHVGTTFCLHQSAVGCTHLLIRELRKIVPALNCSQQGRRVKRSKQVIKETLLLNLLLLFFNVFEADCRLVPLYS